MTADKEKSAEVEATAAPAEATPAEAPKKEIVMEAHYPERDLKNGEVFLKRRTGKPRWRKIVAKNLEAKLFAFDRGDWQQKTAQTGRAGMFKDLRWHLSNKWEKAEKFTPPTAPAKKPKPEAAEASPA